MEGNVWMVREGGQHKSKSVEQSKLRKMRWGEGTVQIQQAEDGDHR